jgi:hypothetical protein
MMLLAITIASTLLAAVTSVIAWKARSHDDDRRRSNARIAALASAIRAEVRGAPVGCADNLFVARPAVRGHSRLATAAAGALFVSAAIVALGVASHAAARASAAATRTERAALATSSASNPADGATVASAAPIQLLALGYSREGDRLVVRGLVRNPSSGPALNRLTAVVLLFREDGGFLGSGRAAVESSFLQPGGESEFTVAVPHASGVGRYRVSFRTEDRVVPHIDKRNADPRT